MQDSNRIKGEGEELKYTAIRALATYEICTVLFKMSLIDLFGISAHMMYLNHKSTTKI